MNKQKIILDCDPGHDDAVAIMLAVSNPNIELLGITVSAGNQTVEKTKVNAAAAITVTRLGAAPSIPVIYEVMAAY